MGDSERETPAARRERVQRALGSRHDGVVRRDELYGLGLTPEQVRAEIAAGRWQRVGRRTISLGPTALSPQALRWAAVWESGSGAVLDGVTALQAAGLTPWDEDMIQVSVRRGTRKRQTAGVRVRELRDLGRTLTTRPPRTAPEVAVLRAAAWARSDRQAVTLLAMTAQQRLVPLDRLREAWEQVERHPRRALLTEAVPLVCDGVQALGEYDFARACRQRRLPEPTRQEARVTSQGKVVLDVRFTRYGVHVEINGVHHYSRLAPVQDALRRNDRQLDGDLTLEIPVLGLLVDGDAFLDQVEAALRRRGWPSPGATGSGRNVRR